MAGGNANSGIHRTCRRGEELIMKKLDTYELFDKYTFEVYYDDEGQDYIVIVPELGCIGDGKTPEEALKDAIDVAIDIIATAIEDGRLSIQCWICGANMQKQSVITTTSWGDFKTEEEATAWVCPNCGEKVFDAEEVERLQELGKELVSQLFLTKEQQKSPTSISG